jgi:hypothetical protein
MNSEIKEKWVAALRSGEYGQTCSQLKRDVENDKQHYCCLGVLGVIAGLHFYGSNEFAEDAEVDAFEENEEGNLPPTNYPALIKFGLTDKMVDKCINMNDTEHLSFAEIADYVETNF